MTLSIFSYTHWPFICFCCLGGVVLVCFLDKCLYKPLLCPWCFLWRMVARGITKFCLIIPKNSMWKTDPRNCKAPFLRGILFLTLRDEKKENKNLSMFIILNIATDCYFQLLIIFCIIFDPITQVKGEISYEEVQRAQSFH